MKLSYGRSVENAPAGSFVVNLAGLDPAIQGRQHRSFFRKLDGRLKAGHDD